MDKQKLYTKMHIPSGYGKLFQFVVILLFVFSASIAAADGTNVSAYKGTFSGEWSGDVMGVHMAGTFTLTVSEDGMVSGSYAIGGIQSGTISGKISTSGDFNAKGSADLTEWRGKINISDGLLSGSGYWKRDGGGGSWSSK